LLSCDVTPGYRYHRRVLKLLQWHCPPTRWWLKSPAHMTTIDALARVYPDARFVMTHRDLGQVLPSVCALKHALGSPLAAWLDLHALGRHETELWSDSLRTTIEFRDDGREHRFFDVAFAELQHDPIGAMERLYAALGDELTDYGLDLDALRSAFAFYHDRFAIPIG
jgi:hypothetical protein